VTARSPAVVSAPPCPFVVSAISTNLPALQAHWSRADASRERPLGTLGTGEKPEVDLGGALCRVSTQRLEREVVMPSSLAADGGTLLVASPWAVSRIDATLAVLDPVVWDLPLLNAVHWLSRSRSGWLIVSSGIDLVFEVDGRGTVLWTWWAMDNGYERDPLGRVRSIDRQADHRGIDYGTLTNVTHVNAAAEMHDGSVLATLFHQGQLVRIRRDGRTTVVLSGLQHPHAVRLLPDGRASIADTGRGRVLLVDVDRGCSEEVVSIATDWLQDARWDTGSASWVLVDGRTPQIVVIPGRTPDDVHLDKAEIHRFAPTWRLYATATDPWLGSER
jgi:hypothetical protein